MIGSHLPKIYFAASVRSADGSSNSNSSSSSSNSSDGALLTRAKMITIASRYGSVLSKRMSAKSQLEMDFGETDGDIFKEDIELLRQADVLIAEVSCASHGVGFVIGASNVPTLALRRRDASGTLSAMLNGCARVRNETYDTAADFDVRVREFITNFVIGRSRILLIGAPGVGKSTLGRELQLVTGARHVSTGEILCSLPDSDPLKQEVQEFIGSGSLVPAETMRRVLKKYLVHGGNGRGGFILDGYPPSWSDLLVLRELGVQPDLVVYMECSKTTSMVRQMQRASRPTDRTMAESRWNTFVECVPDIRILRNIWFPTTPISAINVDCWPGATSSAALKAIATALVPSFEKPYFLEGEPLTPSDVPSDRFHLHVDGSPAAVRALVRTLSVHYPYQLKLYPIDELHLGPQLQSERFGSLYSCMHNFRQIGVDDDKEVSVTGKIGCQWSQELLMDVAKLAKLWPEPLLVELEQYVYEGALSPTLEFREQHSYKAQHIDLTDFNQFCAHQLTPTPAYELHLGFDVVAKTSDARHKPLDLQTLTNKCTAAGMCQGGWFIFASDTHYKYRTSEFSSQPRDECIQTLKQQARKLQRIITRAAQLHTPVSFGLEIVHAIYAFD